MERLQVVVRGHVQGVGFRWFVCARAEELGVSGWVKNTSSGDVEIAASGDEAKLALLEAAIRRGPAGVPRRRRFTGRADRGQFQLDANDLALGL